MARNLLQLVQSFCARQALPQPGYVISNPDAQVAQMLGLLEELSNDLQTRGVWQEVVREATFITVAAEDQGAIATIAPFGYMGIVDDTVFDRTQMMKLRIGIDSPEWQARKAANFTGPLYNLRIKNGRVLSLPAPPVGHTVVFEYFSNFFILDMTDPLNPVPKRRWAMDTDEFALDEEIPALWLRWSWKKEKGLEYAEEFLAYERYLNQLRARNNRPMDVYLDCPEANARPGILVPPGSWPLTGG